MKEINLSNGRMCKVYDFGSNVEIYIFEAGENEALCNISLCVDSCSEFAYKENLEGCFYEISEFVELTVKDKEQIEDVLEIPLWSMSLDQKYEDLKTCIDIGDTYDDPEGEWEIIAINEGQVSVRNIQTGNLNYGREYEVPIEEVMYFVYGYDKDEDGNIEYVPPEMRV